MGINWSFTPVLDINAAFRSPVVATRGFGSDIARIERHALAQIDAFPTHGIAATVKHWPGEGHDDRHQHLVTTIIPLTVEDWDRTQGHLYRAAISAAVMRSCRRISPFRHTYAVWTRMPGATRSARPRSTDT